jgi:hypothetical protein
MVTPVEVGAVKKSLDWAKGAVTSLWRLGKRIATLEERVSALEIESKSVPADGCPYCGERAMRLVFQNPTIMGDRPKQWTEETWFCVDCEQRYVKRVSI